MKRIFFLNAVLFTATWLCLNTAISRADDKVANPKYQVWSGFKPGSSSTVAADVEQEGKHYHITTTRTLISITDDTAVVETKTVSTTDGKDFAEPVRKENIPSIAARDDTTRLGEKSVDAMGKTFKCDVFQVTAGGDSKPGKSPGASHMPGILYISKDVPGGLVRFDGLGAGGKKVVFVLTDLTVK